MALAPYTTTTFPSTMGYGEHPPHTSRHASHYYHHNHSRACRVCVGLEQHNVRLSFRFSLPPHSPPLSARTNMHSLPAHASP